MLRISAFGLALAVAGTAQAQGLVTTQKLSAALANELVGESVAQGSPEARRRFGTAAAVISFRR